MRPRLKVYRVFVAYTAEAELAADRWMDFKAFSPTDAALRAALPALRETGSAWAYVGIGGNRHPNGIPLCCRAYVLRGIISKRLDPDGREVYFSPALEEGPAPSPS